MKNSVNTQVLDQIIADSHQSLEQELADLEAVPETFINVVCEKSYDEMSSKERAEVVAFIEEYLKDNMESGSKLYQLIKQRMEQGYEYAFAVYEVGASLENSLKDERYCTETQAEARQEICSERRMPEEDFELVADKCMIWDLEEELEREKLEML